MANIVAENILMNEKPTTVSRDSKFSIMIIKSLFIDLCDSFDKNEPSLFDVVIPIFVN